jgi:hypothetical protein
MNRKHRIVILALAALLATGSIAMAQTSTSYSVEWHVIGGGGSPVTSAHYAVNSTAGQGAASPPYSTSSHYAVSGGYWTGTTFAWTLYLPLVVRGVP